MNRVLLVDDFPAARRFLREMLEADDFECSEAGNGREAVESFARHHPDWVVMDIEMPDMDGIEATRAICTTDPTARVVIITQHQDPAFQPAALDAGAHTFLHKDDLLTLPSLLASSSEA